MSNIDVDVEELLAAASQLIVDREDDDYRRGITDLTAAVLAMGTGYDKSNGVVDYEVTRFAIRGIGGR